MCPDAGVTPADCGKPLVAAAGCLTTGEEILDLRLGLAGWKTWQAFVGLLATTLAHHVIAVVCLMAARPQFAQVEPAVMRELPGVVPENDFVGE